MSKIKFRLILALILIFSGTLPVSAQTDITLPVYVVQSGDTLYSIALKFNISVTDIVDTNQMSNPDLLSTGMELKIPGLEGVEGKLTTTAIPLGQNLFSLSRYYQIQPATLIRINRLTSPAEVYVGANLILPEKENASLKPLATLSESTSLLEFSVIHNANPWAISTANLADMPENLLPGEKIFTTSTPEEAVLGNPLEPYITKLDLAPLPLVQGSTAVIQITSAEAISISGILNGKELHFYSQKENNYTAIQGIHAMAEPGLSDFSLKITLANGETETLDQTVLLQDAFYAKDPPLSVSPETIDPVNTKPEDTLVAEKIAPITPDKLWSGQFNLPVDEPYCIKSWYGNRRSYNGGPFTYFHTGLDYGVCTNLNILAPAAGVVVFAGPLTVRGNATIIDHGWGIYTGYWHQQEILVHEGDKVEPGQIIGYIGGTGRVTGPHLHFEVWANGVQVNPQEWLNRPIP